MPVLLMILTLFFKNRRGTRVSAKLDYVTGKWSKVTRKDFSFRFILKNHGGLVLEKGHKSHM